MGNGYDPHHNIHHPHHNILHHHHQPAAPKNIFLPMFCRLSIEDVQPNNQLYKHRISGDEPSSPKVSCMGQVKRNNRVTASPSTAAVNDHRKYTKSKKHFSGKTLLPPAAGAAAAGGGSRGSRSCRVSRGMRGSTRIIKIKKEGDQDCVVNIDEMDPPLPVVKRVVPPGVGGDEVNIWKRRFNGEGLKRLQIGKIHLQNNSGQPPTTV